MSDEITSRADLKVLALTERIGQIASDYESKIAELRTDATIQIAALNARIEELQEENENLRKTEGPSNDVAEEESSARKSTSKKS